MLELAIARGVKPLDRLKNSHSLRGGACLHVREGCPRSGATEVALPIYVVLPSRDSPPVERCFGTRPGDAEKSRPSKALINWVR